MIRDVLSPRPRSLPTAADPFSAPTAAQHRPSLPWKDSAARENQRTTPEKEQKDQKKERKKSPHRPITSPPAARANAGQGRPGGPRGSTAYYEKREMRWRRRKRDKEAREKKKKCKRGESHRGRLQPLRCVRTRKGVFETRAKRIASPVQHVHSNTVQQRRDRGDGFCKDGAACPAREKSERQRRAAFMARVERDAGSGRTHAGRVGCGFVKEKANGQPWPVASRESRACPGRREKRENNGTAMKRNGARALPRPDDPASSGHLPLRVEWKREREVFSPRLINR